MSKKALEELRGKPSPDLKGLIDATREELFKMKFAATTEQIDHPNKIQDARRRVARIKTILRQREIEDEKKAQPAASASSAPKAAPAPKAPETGKKK